MKSYVIRIKNNIKSVESAKRCIESALQYGLNVEPFDAITPEDNVYSTASSFGINVSGFDERYSRKENAIACFLSHFSLWKKSFEENETIIILEHDAFFIFEVPDGLSFDKVISIGKPSFGRYNTPQKIGVNSLTSKRYFPGAHGYIVKPKGAEKLINEAKISAKPTDVFLDKNTFPWLEEYYPWIVEARDTFTTVQKHEGCVAKHNFKDGYEII